MKFSEGFVGIISQVKFFMDVQFTSHWSGITHFQGSNDGTTYETLFTMDDNVHSGWNYYTWDEPANYPKFRFYRFF